MQLLIYWDFKQIKYPHVLPKTDFWGNFSSYVLISSHISKYWALINTIYFNLHTYPRRYYCCLCMLLLLGHFNLKWPAPHGPCSPSGCLSLWNFPGKNTRDGLPFPPPGDSSTSVLTQAPAPLHYRWILPLSHWGSPLPYMYKGK